MVKHDCSVNAQILINESDDDSDSNYDSSPEYVITRSGNIKSNAAEDVKPLFKTNDEPVDRYYLWYIIFYLLGMTTLSPWNFFITADEYWMYKFRDVYNHTGPHQKTQLQVMFTSYLSVASSTSSTLFLILNVFLNRRISQELRMLGSLSLIFILFIATTVFVKINTDSWQQLFFIITMVIVIFLNIGSAILSGGLFGIVGKFSSAYITAVVSGQALGGIFAALADILSLTFQISAIFSAFVYFMIANVTIFLAIIGYIILSKSFFFKYHTIDKMALQAQLDASTSVSYYEPISYKKIIKKIWVYGFSIFMVFTVSLAVYPSVTVLVESENEGHGNLWNDVYFVPVVSYLIFSTGDYFGRLFAGFFLYPSNKPWLVALITVLRIVFIPLIMLCNASPRHHLPLLISSDISYIVIIIFFSLTNGYMANIAMINAPKVVESHEKEMASSIMAAFLGAGLACGSGLSLVMVKLL